MEERRLLRDGLQQTNSAGCCYLTLPVQTNGNTAGFQLLNPPLTRDVTLADRHSESAGGLLSVSALNTRSFSPAGGVTFDPEHRNPP